MSNRTMTPEPVIASEEEHVAIARIQDLIRENADVGEDGSLVISVSRAHDAANVALPETLARLFESLVSVLAQGEAVAIVPVDRELTTQQAAELLNVSRQYLVRILDAGAIPFHYTGTHRRVLFEDLMMYKRIRDAQRRRQLARLTELSQAMGLYE